jgi:pimeloyl-ACP methyl ester carboxylesterase
VEEMVNRYSNFLPASLIAYYEAMIQRPDRTHILKTFKNPVFFIMGRHDTAIPFEDSLEQSHLPLLSYIQILKHSGHMGMYEETDKVNNELVNYLHITPTI